MDIKSQDVVKRKILSISVALGVVVFSCVASAITSAENRKTVSVCKIKEPISANALITEDMLYEDGMYYKEFQKAGVQKLSDGSTRQAIVTWDKRDQVVGKRYSAYYLRKDVQLYWDNTVKEQSKKNSYLYNMDGELLNIKLNTDDFGDMVVPGDSLNIRVSYTDTLYNLPTEEQYKMTLSQGGKVAPVETQVSEMLFDEVKVLDMLNKEGKSIFDIYYDFISKDKKTQTALLKADDFLASVKPDTILLEVTSEEADRFAEISGKSPTYLMTLLPRTSTSAILDSLNDIQKAVQANQKEASK